MSYDRTRRRVVVFAGRRFTAVDFAPGTWEFRW